MLLWVVLGGLLFFLLFLVCCISNNPCTSIFFFLVFLMSIFFFSGSSALLEKRNIYVVFLMVIIVNSECHADCISRGRRHLFLFSKKPLFVEVLTLFYCLKNSYFEVQYTPISSLAVWCNTCSPFRASHTGSCTVIAPTLKLGWKSWFNMMYTCVCNSSIKTG